MGVSKTEKENRELKTKKVNLLAALVVEWGQKRYAAPATSAAEFVNAGMPVGDIRHGFTVKRCDCVYQFNYNLIVSNKTESEEGRNETHQLQLVKLIQKGHMLRVYW